MKRDDPAYRKLLSERAQKWWKANKMKHPWTFQNFGNLENSIRSGYKLPVKKSK